MIAKFADVSDDADTKILFQQVAKFGDLDALYQKWIWDGIQAESLIFADSDIADRSVVALEQEVRESPLVREKSSITVKSSAGFTYFNFNFETD